MRTIRRLVGEPCAHCELDAIILRNVSRRTFKMGGIWSKNGVRTALVGLPYRRFSQTRGRHPSMRGGCHFPIAPSPTARRATLSAAPALTSWPTVRAFEHGADFPVLVDARGTGRLRPITTKSPALIRGKVETHHNTVVSSRPTARPKRENGPPRRQPEASRSIRLVPRHRDGRLIMRDVSKVAGKPAAVVSQHRGAKTPGGAKRPETKTVRSQLHLGEKTVQRLGVHCSLVGRNASRVADEILTGWLSRYGKGREIFDQADSPADGDIDDRSSPRLGISLDVDDETD